MKRKCTFLLSTLIIAAALLSTCPTALQAQDTPPPPAYALAAEPAPTFLGISAGALYNMHSGGFGYPNDCADCAVYGDASGIGLAADLRLSLPLTKWFRLEPRLFFEDRGGTFTSEPMNAEIIGQDLKPQTMILEDEFDFSIQFFGLDLLAAMQVGQSGLSVLLGPSAAFRLSESTTVTERIVSPTGAVFLDGSNEAVRVDGATEIARSLQAGIRAGFSYTQPVSRSIAIGIEATYLFPLQTLSENDEWKTSGARGLLSLLYTL